MRIDPSGRNRYDSHLIFASFDRMQRLSLLGNLTAMDGSLALKPLDISSPRQDEALFRYAAMAAWGFVALGVLLRLARYLQCFPLWGDECMVAVNFLDRGYLELMQPLDHWQMCPLLFLWAELTVVKLLGFSEMSLRLFPVICSIAGVFLFHHLARRLLRGVPLVLAVGIFCVSYYLIRHGTEVKQYSLDVLVALGLLTLAVEWRRSPERIGWLWLLVALTPVAVFASFPSVFVAGGVSVALLLGVWRRRDRRVWIPFASYNLVLLGSFAAMYLLFGSVHQQSSLANGVHWHYRFSFPPSEPLGFVAWLAKVHTGRMFAYPVGSTNGGSILTTLCCLVALATLCRSRRFDLLLLCCVPFALGLLAACLHKYPYGANTRVVLYLTPLICLMAGLGAATALGWLRREGHWRRGFVTCLALLVAVGFGSLVRDLIKPYKTPYDREASDFARWFWVELGRDAELACVRSDFNIDLFPGASPFAPAEYLCYQRLYSPRRREGRPLPGDRITAERPLRCVLYYHKDHPPEPEAFALWMHHMQADFEYVDHHVYDVNTNANAVYSRRYDVFEFQPKRPPPPFDVVRRIGSQFHSASSHR